MNDLSRELGGALGIAVIGSVLTATYRANLSLPGYPERAGGQGQGVVRGRCARWWSGSRLSASNAFMDGLHVALLVGSVSALVAAVAVALLLPRSKP